MTDNRGLKNIIFGLLNQLITIAFGLILPRMFIMNYGSETNGLISSVNQVYTYVALLEAGIGTASLQALYKTIASNDRNETNAVLAATNHFYKRTGLWYLLAVCVLSVGFPLIIKSEIPKLTISLVVLFSGLGGVINFLFQGKYRILLRAEGKNYLLSNIGTFVYIASNITKIAFIWLGYSIVVIQVAYFVISIVQMLFIVKYIRKHYHWIDFTVKPNYRAIASKKNVFVHQISDMVFSNTDVMILTMMTGLKTVSVYTMYSSFFNMTKSILYCFLDGVQFSLGQTFNSDFSRFKVMEERFESSYMTLTFILYSILYVLITPFLTIYTRGITDINYVDRLLPLLFSLVFLLQGARGPMQLVINYAQHFKQTQDQAITEAAINLAVTIASVYRFGIYGVLIGTVAALLYRANAIIIYTNRNILKRSPLVTYKRWGWNFTIFTFVYIINRVCPVLCTSYYQWIIRAIPIAMIIAGMYLLGMYVFERESFYWFVDLLMKRFRKKK